MDKQFERKKWLLSLGLSKIRQAESIAILTNYEIGLLEEASQLHKQDPTYKVTLIASSRWTLVEPVLELYKNCKIYFTDSQRPNLIIFEAILHSVNFELSEQDTNSLFKINFMTLYEITHCKKFPLPFLSSSLRKVIDNEQVSEVTEYSLVYPLREGRQLIG